MSHHPPYLTTEQERRLWMKVVGDVATGCLLWTGSLTASGGYAQFSLNRRPVRVHRLMLEMKLGRSLHPGMCSLHTCDTPKCIRQEHLFEGTRRDNTHDMIAKGRGRYPGAKSPARGEKCGAAKLSNLQAREIRALRGVIPVNEIARRYGVDRHTVWKVCSGRSYV